MSEEPFYIRQTAEPMTVEEGRRWFHDCAQEAYEEGATFARYSQHPDIPHLIIVEAWRVQPQDQGEIRWALTGSAS